MVSYGYFGDLMKHSERCHIQQLLHDNEVIGHIGPCFTFAKTTFGAASAGWVGNDTISLECEPSLPTDPTKAA